MDAPWCWCWNCCSVGGLRGLDRGWDIAVGGGFVSCFVSKFHVELHHHHHRHTQPPHAPPLHRSFHRHHQSSSRAEQNTVNPSNNGHRRRNQSFSPTNTATASLRQGKSVQLTPPRKRKKRNRYAKVPAVRSLMYAFGDDPEPLQESVNVLDEIVTEYAPHTSRPSTVKANS